MDELFPMYLLNQIVAGLEGIDPGSPAFVDFEGGEVSFDDFANRVRRLAGGLDSLVPPQDSVGILAMNSREYVEILLAAAWSGRVAVPLNVRWSDQELAEALLDARVEMLCVDRALWPRVAAVRELVPGLRQLALIGNPPQAGEALAYESLLSGAALPMAATREDSTAALIYTGGTTARAKGAMHTQASLLASAMNFACTGPIPRRSRCLLPLPLFHSGAIGIVFAQLLQRNTTVMAPQFRPELVHDSVVRLGVDALVFVPTMLGMLLNAEPLQDGALDAVRAVVYGASPMPSGLLHRVLDHFPNARLTQVYGMTEVGLGVMLDDRLHRGPAARIAAAGQAGPLYRVRVEDESGNELPRGQVGEVVFYGPGVMRGYFNQPETTREAMRNGGLRSGDAGMMDDEGVLTLLDRIKDMIVTGGENVYSVEVESVLSRHPNVAQCSVIGIPDTLYGERVHAVIVPKAGATLDLDTVRAHCAANIAGYKCPRSMEMRDNLPLSPMGKVLKGVLRDGIPDST